MSRRRPPRDPLIEQVARAYDVPLEPLEYQPGPIPCPGPCNRAFRRAEDDAFTEVARARHHHDEHQGRGIQACDPDCATDPRIINHSTPHHDGHPVWCIDVHAFDDHGRLLPHLAHHGCTQRILDALATLPDLATNLRPGRLDTPSTGDTDAQASTGGGARALAHAPSPSPGWDTADLLIRWLVRLEDWLRAHRGDPPNLAATRMMSDAVDYLHANAGALLASKDAEQVGRDVLRAHDRLERLVGQDWLTHRLIEPCPRCGRKGLRRKDGDELVKCGACHAVWDWDHFELLARAYAVNERARGAAQ